jgi:hypothetical protein
MLRLGFAFRESEQGSGQSAALSMRVTARIVGLSPTDAFGQESRVPERRIFREQPAFVEKADNVLHQ